MSSPDISELVLDLCEKLDKDPDLVKEIRITPDSVIFEMILEPLTAGPDGEALTGLTAHLWR